MEEAICKMEAKIEEMSGQLCHCAQMPSPISQVRDEVLPLSSPSDLFYGTPAIVPAELEAVGGTSSDTRVDRAEEIPSLSSSSEPLPVPPPRPLELGDLGHSVSEQRCIRRMGRFNRRDEPYGTV